MAHDFTIIEADLADSKQAAALVELFDRYMRDPMEGGAAMPPNLRRDLVPGLLAHPSSYVFLAYHADQPVGFAICFLGFSTFNARPLLNIHDISVLATMRGKGAGAAMLAQIEDKARALNCCRLTLEVREDNHVARGLYRKSGFAEALAGTARMEFWNKTLA
ncbi:MAG: GNAT family N-acetyltransferase [Candidatus Binataceae bacterium]